MVKSNVIDTYGALMAPLFIVMGRIFIERETLKKKYSILGILSTILGFLFFLNEIETTKSKQKYILWIWFAVLISYFMIMIVKIERNMFLYFSVIAFHFASWATMAWFLSKNDFNERTQYIMISIILIMLGSIYYIPKTVKRAEVFGIGIPLYSIGWTLLTMSTIYNY